MACPRVGLSPKDRLRGLSVLSIDLDPNAPALATTLLYWDPFHRGSARVAAIRLPKLLHHKRCPKQYVTAMLRLDDHDGSGLLARRSPPIPRHPDTLRRCSQRPWRRRLHEVERWTGRAMPTKTLIVDCHTAEPSTVRIAACGARLSEFEVPRLCSWL